MKKLLLISAMALTVSTAYADNTDTKVIQAVNIQLTHPANFSFLKIFDAFFIHSPWQEQGDVLRRCRGIFGTGL
jgi:hypothetical protein